MPILCVSNVECASRVDWLRDKYRDKEVKPRTGPPRKVKSYVFDFILKTDPTPKKIYSQWMLTMFVNRKLKAEDVYKLADDLKAYHKHKQRMPVKDINRIKDPMELFKMVEPFLGEQTKGDLNRKERKEIRKEIKVVYDGPHGKILIPKTERASCYVGRGTRWCTAADKNNAFEDYSAGPLYVLLPKGNRGKFQVYLPDGQFMDAADEPVSVDTFRGFHAGLWDEFQKSLSDREKIEAVRGGWDSNEVIRLIDDLPEEAELVAVKEDGTAIRNIRNPSEKVKLSAVRQTPQALNYIQKPSGRFMVTALKRAHTYQGIDLVILAYKLDKVKKPLPDEFVQLALKEYPEAFRDVPKKHMTDKLQMAILDVLPEMFIHFPKPLSARVQKHLDKVIEGIDRRRIERQKAMQTLDARRQAKRATAWR